MEEKESKILEVIDLSANYYKNDKFDIKEINFYINNGEVLGILGRNGAGKTTLLKTIAGFKSIENGEIVINGHSLQKDIKEAKESIGYVGTEWIFSNESRGKDIGRYYGSFYKNFDYDEFVKWCERLKVNINTNALFYSLGEKVKFSLAFVLSHLPKLLIMDEPFSNLDPVVREEILEILREYLELGDKSIIYSTHMIHELETIADRILFMDKGRQKLFADVNEIQDRYFNNARMDLEKLFEIVDDF